MKAEYKNSIRSRKLIIEAVHQLLLKKKDLNAITITDIVNESGLNRGTFYNHYNNIGEVIDDIEDDLMAKLNLAWESAKIQNNSMSNFIHSITAFLKENETQYKMIVNYIPQYVFDELKEKVIYEINHVNNDELPMAKDEKITLYLIANGIAGSYIDYLKGKLNISIDDLEKVAIETITKMLGPDK